MATYDEPLVVPLGDSAFVVTFGDDIGDRTHRRVRALTLYLDRSPLDAMIDYIPAYTTVTLVYDAAICDGQRFQDELQRALQAMPDASDAPPGDLVEVPVCYGGEFGPDLEFVASRNSLSPQEVIDIHADRDYLVYMIGFVPGFPYLGGMSERIATPRKDSPRQAIPAGSVGIAGKQTGIYPMETPGGWQLIGRTPVRLFRPHLARPSLLAAGDRVRFTPIGGDDYERLLERERLS